MLYNPVESSLAPYLRSVRQTLLDTPDSVCLDRARLITEAWQGNESQPLPLRRAHAFAHVLQGMTLDVITNPLIAGNTSSRPRAWMLCPEYGIGIDGQILIENDGLEGLLDLALPPDIAAYWQGRAVGGHHGVGHLAVDLDTVVNRGLDAVMDDIHAALDQGDESQRIYRRAMLVTCKAVIEWAERYADAADQAASIATDPILIAAHRRVAAACRHVPAQPARDLFEGLQAIALIHLAIHIEGHGLSVSIGSPDRVLARFADQADDLNATEHIAAFALCLMANSVQGRGSKTQAVTIGGIDHTGADQSNAITQRFLDAWDLVRPNDPHLFVRWHHDLNSEVKAKAIDMLCRGLSMPLLIHDTPTVEGFIAAGVRSEHAHTYCVIGCNELGIPGRLAKSAAPIVSTVYIQLLTDWLTTETGVSGQKYETIDALFNAFAAYATDRIVAGGLHNAHRHVEMAERTPTPFTSSLMLGCIDAGRDMHNCQSYDLFGAYERGLTNAVNALAAIEHTIFTHRTLTLPQLLDAMRDNFADPAIHEQLRNAPKFGNDDDIADKWAIRLLAMRKVATDQLEVQHHHPHYLACHVVRSLHRMNGSRLGASPDGRRAREPLADSIGAEAGTATEGPTAMLNSVLKIDAARYYQGGYNLNLTLTPRSAQTDVVRPLIEAFFDAGGQELQISTLDVNTLRHARINPEAYRDLVVRIAGFNALWYKLSAAERDEIIERAESAF